MLISKFRHLPTCGNLGFGATSNSVNDNKLILDKSIKYILETKTFEGPIFYVKES